RAAVEAEEFVTNLVSSASPEAKKAVYRANEFAGSRVPVLIEGAPGTGVEHLAHFLHLQSARSQAAFVVLDARRLGAGELQQMLAGGAAAASGPARPSERERADGGTLFLDGIEHVDPRVQRQLVPLMLGVSD